jgi:hypothetical protein
LAWRHDLIASPRLARMLHPKIRQLLITETELTSAVTETDRRVSLYFNDKGRELKTRRYVGSLAGRLH